MPTLKQRIEAMGTIIKALVALLALMPGIAVLTGLIDIPPTLVQLVQALSFFVSVAVLIGILLASQLIRGMSSSAVALIAFASVLAGAAAAVGYWSFAGSHIVVVSGAGEGDEDKERFVVPLRPSAEVERLVAPYGGDYAEALKTSNQRVRLQRLLEAESGGTAALMIVLLVLAQTLLVAGVAAGAWRLTMADEEEQSRTAVRPSAPPPPSPPRQAAS